MPDSDNRRPRLTLTGDFPPNPRADYVELAVTTPYSFLRGASHASELVATSMRAHTKSAFDPSSLDIDFYFTESSIGNAQGALHA